MKNRAKKIYDNTYIIILQHIGYISFIFLLKKITNKF